MADLKSLKEAGAVGFTDDGLPLLDENLTREAMRLARTLKMLLSFHEEDPKFIKENGINHGSSSDKMNLYGADRQAEISMVVRDCKLAKETGATISIQHISAKESVEAVRKAKKLGIRVFAEATPHHFSLTDKDVIKYGTLAKMNPPLREEEDRIAIIEGLKDGTIDMIATDHAPHSLEEKEAGLMEAPNGIIGLETAYPVLHTLLVDGGIISDNRLIDLMSVQPARLLGQNVYDPLAHLSSQEEGNPVCDLKSWSYSFDDPWAGQAPDLVILDTDKTWTIEAKDFLSKARNTPFDQWTVTGKAMATILSGSLSYASPELMAILAKKEDSWTD